MPEATEASGASMGAGPTIRAAGPADSDAIARIYNHYVLESIATFEERAITDVEMATRIAGVDDAGLPWLVSESDGVLAGYAYAGPWRVRPAYRHSVELSVYIAPDYAAKGHGSRLYAELFARLRAGPVHAVMAGIALPAPASVALHEKFGMRQVAHLKEVGYKFGRWIDVGYWQSVL